ncbi:MAG: hypothetical protein COS10_00045, partial [Nitrospirae bacterium CG01_land_8_20_14_3_00_44_22]
LSEKRKGIHQLTRHIWLRLFTKASTQIATQLQICRNVSRSLQAKGEGNKMFKKKTVVLSH